MKHNFDFELIEMLFLLQFINYCLVLALKEDWQYIYMQTVAFHPDDVSLTFVKFASASHCFTKRGYNFEFQNRA